jgi:hypothetical protein
MLQLTSDGVNMFDFETGTLKRVNEPPQWSGSVGTGKDVLVHE